MSFALRRVLKAAKKIMMFRPKSRWLSVCAAAAAAVAAVAAAAAVCVAAVAAVPPPASAAAAAAAAATAAAAEEERQRQQQRTQQQQQLQQLQQLLQQRTRKAHLLFGLNIMIFLAAFSTLRSAKLMAHSAASQNVREALDSIFLASPGAVCASDDFEDTQDESLRQPCYCLRQYVG